jgi:PST family polysaccharide transporter
MRLGNVALMAVVARLVVPAEFGVFSLGLVVFAFISSVAEAGVASAVARSDLDLDRIAPTVTTIALTTSTVLAVAMATSADPLAHLLGSPQVAPSLRILSICVLLIGVFAVPGAQLQREFRQDRLFLANAVSFVPGSAALVLLALHGDGATAFAWSRVVGQVVTGAIMTASVSRRFRPGWSRPEAKALLAYGLPLGGANLLSQVVVNVDYLIVGRLLDVTAVGVYTLAFNVSSWATSAIGSMLNGVVLPAFSAIRAASGDLVAAVRRATRVVGVVAFGIVSLTSGLAAPLVRVLYGPTWLAAAGPLVILGIYGVVSVLGLLLANIVIAMGRTTAVLGVQVAVLALLMPALYVGIGRLGILGAALAHVAVALAVTLPVYARALRSATGARLRDLLEALAPPAVAGAAAWLAAHFLALPFGGGLVSLLVGGAGGGALYFLLMARDVVGFFGSRHLPAWAREAVRVTDPARSWLVGRPATSAAGEGRA